MSELSQDPDQILQQAIEAFCAADPSLAGSVPKQYVVVLESERPGKGSTFSVMRSGNMRPWEFLGLLRFAQIQHEAEALYGSPDDE
jgi:hypothetical protein